MSLTKSLPACLVLSFASFATYAADGPPPSVNEPSGINLGGTSFYDGFAGPPGLSHLTYLKFSTAHSIKDNAGKDNGAFDNPKINIITLINQLSMPIALSLKSPLPGAMAAALTSADSSNRRSACRLGCSVKPRATSEWSRPLHKSVTAKKGAATIKKEIEDESFASRQNDDDAHIGHALRFNHCRDAINSPALS
jgi:hypothetical protein